MKRQGGEIDWDALDARLKTLRTVTGPRAVAGYAEALALLYEHLARCLQNADARQATLDELSRLAKGLREAAGKLERHGTSGELNGGLRGQPLLEGCNRFSNN